MVGQTCTVLSSCLPNGQVQLRGEIWEARCDTGADRGDTVVVLAIEGLTLIVERAEVVLEPFRPMTPHREVQAHPPCRA